MKTPLLLPQIDVTLPVREMTPQVVEALVAANNPPTLFTHSTGLARVRAAGDVPIIEIIKPPMLRGYLARTIDFVTPTDHNDDAICSVDPPSRVVRDILALPELPFPSLAGIVETPVLRPDGSILDIPGYDEATQLVYQPSTTTAAVAKIPTMPSKAQITVALKLLDELAIDFPFDSQASKANFLAFLLTPFLRPAILGPVPLGLFDKPAPGVGASLLANCISRIVTGRDIPTTSQPSSKDEWHKRITSSLLGAGQLGLIDNVNAHLDSASLAAMLTATSWTDRMLGGNTMVELPQHITWLATGVNVTCAGEIARRVVWIRLNATQEQPWLRTGFCHPNLRAWVSKNRSRLIVAALTICRAYFAAGCPTATVPTFGSFESWAETVGGVAHAGIDGFLGNHQSLWARMDDDGPAFATFFQNWYAAFGAMPVTVSNVVAKLSAHPELKAAIEALPPGLDPQAANFSQRLGLLLRQKADSVHGGLRLQRIDDAKHAKVARWRVVPAGSSGEQPTVRKTNAKEQCEK